jgi:hypothetical protein
MLNPIAEHIQWLRATVFSLDSHGRGNRDYRPVRIQSAQRNSMPRRWTQLRYFAC